MSTQLAKYLEDICRERFSANQYRRGSGEKGPYFTFPAVSEDFGDIDIYIEEFGAEYGNRGEYTVVVGHFTHRHFDCSYDEQAIPDWEAELAEELADYLEGIFSNEIEAYGSHEGGGGTARVGEEGLFFQDEPRHRWSGG